MFPEKNQDSGRGIGPVCGGQQFPARKWWKERVMSVMALICGSLKHSHMDLQEHVLEGRKTWGKLMD